MTEKPTETLYKKVGRRYVPVAAKWYEDDRCDQMKTGAFRLTYAYNDGGRRYEYDVTPATAPVVAAMMIARVAIEEAITKASRMEPMSLRNYTKKQKAIIDEFREKMGGMLPTYWTAKSAYKISEAAIKAVQEFKP